MTDHSEISAISATTVIARGNCRIQCAKIYASYYGVRGNAKTDNVSPHASQLYRGKERVTREGKRAQEAPEVIQLWGKDSVPIGDEALVNKDTDPIDSCCTSRWIDQKNRKFEVAGGSILYDSVKEPDGNTCHEKETIIIGVGDADEVTICNVDKICICGPHIRNLCLENVGDVFVYDGTVIENMKIEHAETVSVAEDGGNVTITNLKIDGALATTLSGDSEILGGTVRSALVIFEGHAVFGPRTSSK